MIIDGIELHDLPVNGIDLDFTSGVISIKCEVYDEKMNCYKSVVLRFTQVTNISSGAIETLACDVVEIFSADVTDCNTGGYSIVIVFLTGFSKPSFQISFNYKEVLVC